MNQITRQVMKAKYAELVFDIPTKRSFYYSIPTELQDLAQVGVRAVAPIGKRILTGFIIDVLDNVDFETKEIKEIEDILDPIPFFDKKFLKLANWVADYYFSSLGEVLATAVPYGTDIESKKIIQVDIEPLREEIKNTLKEKVNYIKLLEILSEKEEHTITELIKKLKKAGVRTNINYYLNKIEKKGLASVFIEKRKPLVKVKKEKVVELTINSHEKLSEVIHQLEKRSPKQVDTLIALYSAKEKKLTQKELIQKVKITPAVLKALEKKRYIKINEVEVKREYVELFQEEKKTIVLTEEQQKAINLISESINKDEFNVYLIHGVTGSGKTQVYLELIDKILKRGKNAIYLVPEISLTPQVIRRIKNHFGDKVGIMHSRLSPGERYDEWRAIIRGEYRIVVGPRSAIFAPIKNIRLIVVDEEHDFSYKQSGNPPYYNGRDVAIKRGQYENAVVILGSATPSLESYHNALQGKYKLIEMKKRVDNALLPQINIIDMRQEKKEKKIIGSFSEQLINKIKEKIKKNEKVILLQNRRGFATYIMCPDCGYIEQCKDCSVTLTYHLVKKEYVCHYCGYSKKELKACPVCGSMDIRYKGIGTQRVEDELEQLITYANIARMDFDTTQKKYAYSKILNEFAEGKYNILLGTQMVSKGLDFPDVTLVGVISAESTMLIPDFRATERTFQLLSQVSGRSGRSHLQGEVIIQTYRPESYVLEHVRNHDYEGFYRREIIERTNAKYPPFYRLALLEFRGLNLQQVKYAALEFKKLLKYDDNIINVLGPTPAYLSKLAGKYRWHILIKSNRSLDSNGTYLHKVINMALNEYRIKVRKISNVRLSIDIDPISTI